MAIDQAKLKDTIKSALDDMFDTKLASLLDTKLEPLRTSMEFISKSFDDMEKKIVALEKSNAELAKENHFLRQESSRVSNSLNQMKAALDDQEQYIRRDCLEIRGVPTSSSEDTNEIVKNIGSLVDVCIEDKDISISHRIKSGTIAISPIIVKFTRRGVGDNLYKARTKLKNITSGNLGLGRQGGNKIFIQESLTSSRKDLFHDCNEFKKKFKFRYIWSYYGNIFLRKDEASPSVKICSPKDLAKLEGKHKPPSPAGSGECSIDAQIAEAGSNDTNTT